MPRVKVMTAMNKWITFVIVLGCTVMLSGCWNHAEPERMQYVFGIGIDFEDDKYHAHALVINLASIAKTEQPVFEKVQSEIGHTTGETIDDALVELYNSIGQKAYWGHLTYLVFSEEALVKEKLSPVIDLFLRFRETRYRIELYTTKGSTKDILLTTPINNKAISISKLADPSNSYDQESFIPAVDIRTLLIGLNEPTYEVAVPYVARQENWETVDEPSEVIAMKGVGIVTPDGFKGFMEGKDVYGISWMSKETKRKQLTTSIGSDEENKISVTMGGVKQKVKPIIEGDTVTFDITVQAVISLGFVTKDVTEQEIIKAVEKQIKKEVEHTYEAALEKDVDIYRLSEHLYRKDVKTWKRLEEAGKVPLSKDSIENLTVKVKLAGGRRDLKSTVD